MPNYEPLIDQIAQKTGVAFRPASPFELSKLDALGLPQSVIDFYEAFEPAERAGEEFRLWPIEHILEENEALVPGCHISKHGYIVFATTLYGDTYCFDLTRPTQVDPPIVLISHEVVDETTTALELRRLAKPVAKGLYELLQQFARGEIDDSYIT
jgi:hypothetical protein